MHKNIGKIKEMRLQYCSLYVFSLMFAMTAIFIYTNVNKDRFFYIKNEGLEYNGTQGRKY